MSDARAGRLPLAQYASKHGVLACLLLSSFCLLPRSKWPYALPTDRPPLDRPEWEFLVPLTVNPVRSMVYDILGISFCVLWWAPSLRTWWSPVRLTDRDARVRQTLKVSQNHLLLCSSTDMTTALFGSDCDDFDIDDHHHRDQFRIRRQSREVCSYRPHALMPAMLLRRFC